MGPFRGPYRGSPLRDPCWWVVTTEVAAHWEEVLMGPFRGGTHKALLLFIVWLFHLYGIVDRLRLRLRLKLIVSRPWINTGLLLQVPLLLYNCFTATFGVFGHYIPGFESLNPVVLMSYHNNEE